MSGRRGFWVITDAESDCVFACSLALAIDRTNLPRKQIRAVIEMGMGIERRDAASLSRRAPYLVIMGRLPLPKVAA